MDYTSITESFGYSTAIVDDGDIDEYDNRNINDIKYVMASQLYLGVKHKRLTRFRLNQKNCKTQFILMLLGLWMNLISVANGKWIISKQNWIITIELWILNRSAILMVSIEYFMFLINLTYVYRIELIKAIKNLLWWIWIRFEIHFNKLNVFDDKPHMCTQMKSPQKYASILHIKYIYRKNCLKWNDE